MKIVARDIPPRAAWALEQAGVHPLLARLYAARGVRAKDELDDGLGRLLPPAGLKGIDTAARLLADAMAQNQRLVIVSLNTAQTEHFDQIIGLPTQWLDNSDELLIRQSAKPVARWYRFALSRVEQQALVASELAQVIHNNTRYEITENQLQTASSTVLFAAADKLRIVQHFAKANGLYLLLASSETPEVEVWLFNFVTGNTEKITSVTLPSSEISDINQQQLLYSTFATDKDIHTLTLKRQP